MDRRKKIVSIICQAQRCSDNAKATDDRDMRASFYDQKLALVLRAIKLIDCSISDPGVSYFCVKSPDQNNYPSVVTYFDIRDYGQVSFHCPWSIAPGNLRQKGVYNKGTPTRWDQEQSSRETCSILSKCFNIEY